MDLNIRVLFDEDLKSMIFPKVQEFEFKANSHSPLEICAKILAIQNDHRDKWEHYEFSICKQSKQLKETLIQDLRKTFSSLKEKDNQDQLTLFYRIRDIKNVVLAQ